jgi:hypothetical protein
MPARGRTVEAHPVGGATRHLGHDATLERLDRLAYWLDERFRLPGTNVRMGLDGLLGLVPGIGDTLGGLISAYILLEAWRLGIPNSVLMRMLANLGIDVVVGSVPVLGDVFDIGWKANRRNVNLLLRHLRAGGFGHGAGSS